jgi:CRISPR/Cas system-associated protein Cas10 (large subunit of type III CRISPR-Cas system)
MPDLAGILLRTSARTLDSGRKRCSTCRRTPLIGERLHEMENGSTLCELCVAKLPVDARQAVSSERIHAADRHLAVAPRAA